MYIKAPAKINLALNILDKREDGYHDLDMIIVPLDLHDSIEIEIFRGSDTTYITCDEVSLASNKYNLASIAIKKARDIYHFKENFEITIHKEIPISAGLGGGSANAAAVLIAIFKLLKITPTKQELIDLAKTIGADVPYCLFNTPSRVSGIGEFVEPIACKNKYFVLIVKPQQGLSTKEVFSQCDQKTYKNADIPTIIDALKTGDDVLLSNNMSNALQDTAINMLPAIKDIIDGLHKDGLSAVMMSGSGSAVFALSHDHHLLSKLEKKYDNLGYEVVLTKTI